MKNTKNISKTWNVRLKNENQFNVIAYYTVVIKKGIKYAYF